MRDPKNPKDSVFIAAGTPLPQQSMPGVVAVHRDEGTLLTTDFGKAQAFRDAPKVTDGLMAGLLGYPETKGQAVASGAPVVVQGKDAAGNVATESLASPAGVPAAEAAAGQVAPNVSVTTPEAAQVRRTEEAQPFEWADRESGRPAARRPRRHRWQGHHAEVRRAGAGRSAGRLGLDGRPEEVGGRGAGEGAAPAGQRLHRRSPSAARRSETPVRAAREAAEPARRLHRPWSSRRP